MHSKIGYHSLKRMCRCTQYVSAMSSNCKIGTKHSLLHEDVLRLTALKIVKCVISTYEKIYGMIRLYTITGFACTVYLLCSELNYSYDTGSIVRYTGQKKTSNKS